MTMEKEVLLEVKDLHTEAEMIRTFFILNKSPFRIISGSFDRTRRFCRTGSFRGCRTGRYGSRRGRSAAPCCRP